MENVEELVSKLRSCGVPTELLKELRELGFAWERKYEALRMELMRSRVQLGEARARLLEAGIPERVW
jgi:hypothetical protein